MQPNSKRIITIPLLTLYNVSIMASLRNLPLVAEFGFSSLFYFLIVAILFLVPCALVSAELATGWPKSGGIYIWIRAAFGDRLGFVAIWLQWIHNIAWYPAILSFVVTTLFYLIDPLLLTQKGTMLAMILILFWGMTLFNSWGLKTSSLLSAFGVILGTILPGICIILLGATWILKGNPLATSFSVDALIPDKYSLSNIVFIGGLFLAFSGLEVSASYAGEVQNPRKNYPKAILLSALITLVLFSSGTLSIASVIPKQELNLVSGVMDAMTTLLAKYKLSFLIPFFGVSLAIGAIAEINSWIIGPVKALHFTSIHGNLPKIFQRVNKKNVPINLLVFQGILVSLVSLVLLNLPSLTVTYWILSAMSAQIYLLMYLLMFIGAIRLRYTMPTVPRPYQIPHRHKGMWIVACIGSIASLFAIIVSFIPPKIFDVGNLLFYEGFLIGSLVLFIALPFIIYHFKKPSWGE